MLISDEERVEEKKKLVVSHFKPCLFAEEIKRELEC